MVLMVVVVVAVGGVLPACLPTLENPDYLRTCGKVCGKVCGKICLMTPTSILFRMGRPCGKFGYLEWVGHVEKRKDNGPKERRRRHFVMSLSVMTCTRHDYIYVYILLIYMLLLAAFIAAAG